MDAEAVFSRMPPTKLFLYVAIPGLISMAAGAAYQATDGILVGQFLGELAFAALTLALPFVVINFALADLIGVGASVPISLALGEGRKKDANNIFTCAVILIVLSGILLGLLLYFAAPVLFPAMGADPELSALAVSYLQVFALLSPVTTATYAIDNFLRVCGKVKMSMGLNLVSSLGGLALEVLFLGVFKGGIASAALAICIGMIVGVTIGSIPLLRGRYLLKPCMPKFSFSMVKTIVICGTPNFLQNVAGRVIEILMNVLLLRFGGPAAVSVYGIVMYADGIILPFIYGMCDSLQPTVSYNWGAGLKMRVKAIEMRLFTACALVSVLAVILVSLFPTQIALLFLPDVSAEFLVMAETALRLFALAYLVKWFAFAVQSLFLAVGKARTAITLSVASTLVFPILMMIVLLPLELTGIWMNFAASATLGAIFAGSLLFRYRKLFTAHAGAGQVSGS